MLSKFLRITDPKPTRTFTAFLPPPLNVEVDVTEMVYYVYYSFLPFIRVARTKYLVGQPGDCIAACRACHTVLVENTEYAGTITDCLARTAADIHAASILHHDELRQYLPKC